MTAEISLRQTSLYETDYQLWLEQTVVDLRSQNFHNLDLENLIEEIESLGKRDKRAIASYLRRLLEHLLKIKHWQTERQTCFRGWDLEVSNFRLNIAALLKDSPSLKNHLSESFVSEYKSARKLFLKASELDAAIVPQEPKFTLSEVLNEDWLPWRPE
ncbi:DUF29 domain-containing protein [Leptolyngbya cf. ectocarpi LEGE 11479]|uniref:DUF29 domain-containing protein n=2 Tax=Leptolyngbya ectocarpi TaxID=1202 RepID=A0A928X1V4_LEPEC|nr:DUF29 domain-containing protein [Leptolyngbya cf. ectocarpi LEGE 11479]